MSKTRTPYPAVFREPIIALHHAGREVKDLAQEFEPCADTIRGWIKQAERDAGQRADILSTEEREELRRLRRDNKRLRQERDILSKAAAWFAHRETSPRSSIS